MFIIFRLMTSRHNINHYHSSMHQTLIITAGNIVVRLNNEKEFTLIEMGTNR